MPKAQSECLAHLSLPRIHFLEDIVGITVIFLDPDKPGMMVPGRFLSCYISEPRDKLESYIQSYGNYQLFVN